MERISWDRYFCNILKQVSGRSTCNRGKSGCIIVSEDNYMLATGYVGSPRGMPHCDDVGHDFTHVLGIDSCHTTKHCIRTVHAEQNAICQAARKGISLENSKVYITMVPCYTCAKMLVQCGVKRVYCLYDYHKGRETKQLFQKCGIRLIIEKEEMCYDPNAED